MTKRTFWGTVKEKFSSNNETQASEATNLHDRLNNIQGSGWGSTFIKNMFGERILTPHEEMETARKIYFYNSLVEAASDGLRDFAFAGDVWIESDNKSLEIFGANFLRDSGIRENCEQIFSDLINFGNCYLEPVRLDSKQYKQGITHYLHYPYPERVFHDYDKNGNVTGYIVRVPNEQYTGAQQHTIRYVGDQMKSVRGYKASKDEFEHIKRKVGTIPSYGRGQLATIVNDAEVMLEVERSMGVIVRNKAIPRKIITSENLGSREQLKLKSQLNSVKDTENVLLNIPVTVHDLSYAGKELNFTPISDHLKRKLTVHIAPEFLIHGENTNRATSKEQREAFMLRVKSMRSVLKDWIHTQVRKAITGYEGLQGTFEVKFGEFDIGEKTESRQLAVDLWVQGLVTLDEARNMLDLEAPDEEIQGAYKWELDPEPTVQNAIEKTIQGSLEGKKERETTHKDTEDNQAK